MRRRGCMGLLGEKPPPASLSHPFLPTTTSHPPSSSLLGGEARTCGHPLQLLKPKHEPRVAQVGHGQAWGWASKASMPPTLSHPPALHPSLHVWPLPLPCLVPSTAKLPCSCHVSPQAASTIKRPPPTSLPHPVPSDQLPLAPACPSACLSANLPCP